MNKQRPIYPPHIPAGGEIVLFDRSLYNRAGVERVMGFCSERETETFLKDVPLVERAIVDSGVILLKQWTRGSQRLLPALPFDWPPVLAAGLRSRALPGVLPGLPPGLPPGLRADATIFSRANAPLS